MESGTAGLRWGVGRRLEFIEFRLFWEGVMNRGDLINYFGVSIPQASKDLTMYQERAPGNMEYDKSAKHYYATADFKPQLLTPDPDQYLVQLRSLCDGLVSQAESWISRPPTTDVALTPNREIDVDVLREILRSVRERKSVDIRYQSMNPQRPDPMWRRITPHAFGFEGFRWHARAYCHLDDRFKDFLLPRILGIRKQEAPGAAAEQDTLWHKYFDIEIAPHPALTKSQQHVVEKDYGLKDGKGVFSVRYAMLFYSLKRLGLLGNPAEEDPRRQHIVARNKRAVQAALEKSNYSQGISRPPDGVVVGGR